MESLRKRNASDGDSGFDSALSSRSSSISLEESQDLLDFKVSKVEVTSEQPPPLREQFSHILNQNEDIFKDVCTPSLFIIRDRQSGSEIMYKPPSKLSFSTDPPRIGETFSAEEYNRCNPIPRSQLFNARLQLELEKQVAKMELLEVNLLMDNTLVPPPSLGIRVIGVNMIHGVPDKLNIYVKRVMEGSVAGLDGRIKVNDHIVEVNGVSLIGVSQKLAAEALSSCAVNPETGVVNFVLARAPSESTEAAQPTDESALTTDQPPTAAAEPSLSDTTIHGTVKERSPSPLPTMHESPRSTKQADYGGSVQSKRRPDSSSLSDPRDLLIAASALHCGESTAFLPLGPDTRPRLTLSDMPAPVIAKISNFLSPGDKISLSKVNKSFYAALTAGHADDPTLNAGSNGSRINLLSSRTRPPILPYKPPSDASPSSTSVPQRIVGGQRMVPCV